MTLYVDNVKILAGVHNQWTGRTVRGKWCHLISDLLDPGIELHPFAVGVLGLKRVYFQQGTNLHGEYCPGHDHYDLIESKRSLAIRHGAQAIAAHELGMITLKKTELWQAMVAVEAERLKVVTSPDDWPLGGLALKNPPVMGGFFTYSLPTGSLISCTPLSTTVTIHRFGDKELALSSILDLLPTLAIDMHREPCGRPDPGPHFNDNTVRSPWFHMPIDWTRSNVLLL